MDITLLIIGLFAFAYGLVCYKSNSNIHNKSADWKFSRRLAKYLIGLGTVMVLGELFLWLTHLR